MIITMLILFILSFLMTGLCRYYALSHNVLDIPNDRSSHVIPTPRGGGLAFVSVFLAYVLILSYKGAITSWETLGFFVSGLTIASLGLIDDHRPISPLFRLMVHFAACGFALYCLGDVSASSVWNTLTAQILVSIVVLVYLAWLLNLYNFMDGIDGLAALEGISVCLGGAFIYWIYDRTSMMAFPLAMSAALAGFLLWNFPRARIFMGDAGSGFLGLMIGLFSVEAALKPGPLFWSWLILSGVFIVDATVTLLWRAFDGSRVYEAHRDHAYQQVASMLQDHVKVTLGVVVINLIWLLPLATLVGGGYLNGIVGLIIAYLPMTIFVIQLKSINTVSSTVS